MTKMEKLYVIYGSKVFCPAWHETETGEKVLIIVKE